MSNIQMISALGAMTVLSMIIIRMNDNSNVTRDVLYESTFGVLATSLATSIIEEANRKHFDSTTDTTFITNSTLLTAPDRLGCEAGENAGDISTFNDFDDFNGYTRIDSSMPSATFRVECRVVYVAENNLDVQSAQKTWHKKLTVYVTSPYMHGAAEPSRQDTIALSSVFSYWSMR